MTTDDRTQVSKQADVGREKLPRAFGAALMAMLAACSGGGGTNTLQTMATLTGRPMRATETLLK